MSSLASPPKPRRATGRWVVLTMFAFGIVATGGIWVYWKLHLAPFLPLQKALADEFEKSSPRVDGGWAKNEFGKTPPRLRIVLNVRFPPEEGDPKVTATIDRIIELVREHIDLSAYETLQVYLVHFVPERAPQQYQFEAKIRDVMEEQPSPAGLKPGAE